MLSSQLLDKMNLQVPLVALTFLSVFFLRYILFFSLIPLGCSRLTVALLSLSMALTAFGIGEGNYGWSLELVRSFRLPGLDIWIQQGLLGIEAALPFILMSCVICLLATLLEGIIGGGFLSLFSPWFKGHSSSLRTMMDSWAICVVLAPEYLERLVGDLFKGISLTEMMVDGGPILWGGAGSGLILRAEELLTKLTELIMMTTSFLMMYLFIDLAAVMISKSLNRGMFQAELSQLKGVLTLVIFIEATLDPEGFLSLLGQSEL